MLGIYGVAPFVGWCDALPQEHFAMDIAEFPPLDETQKRLPKGASAPDLERMARADSVRNAIRARVFAKVRDLRR